MATSPLYLVWMFTFALKSSCFNGHLVSQSFYGHCVHIIDETVFVYVSTTLITDTHYRKVNMTLECHTAHCPLLHHTLHLVGSSHTALLQWLLTWHWNNQFVFYYSNSKSWIIHSANCLHVYICHIISSRGVRVVAFWARNLLRLVQLLNGGACMETAHSAVTSMGTWQTAVHVH